MLAGLACPEGCGLGAVLACIAGIAAPITGTQILERAGATALWTGIATTCLVLAAGQLLIVPPLNTHVAHAAHVAEDPAL